MKHKVGSFILFLSKAILFLMLVTVFFLGQRYFYEDTLFYFWGNIILIIIYAAILYLANRVYNGFDFSNLSIQEIIVSWIMCLIIANVFQYFFLSLIRADRLTQAEMLPLAGFAGIFGIQVGIVAPVSIAINALYYKLNPAQSTVLIFGDKRKLKIYKSMIAKQQKEFKIVDTISQHVHIGTLLDAINSVQSVFFLDVDEAKLEGFIEYCYLNDKHTYILPTFSRVLVHTASTIWLANTPVFSLKKPEPDVGTLIVKRIIDIVISLIAIIASSPVMLIICIAIRLHDRGPVVFKQVRVTKGGREFKMYKFRSMVASAEDDGVPRLSAIHDPRITPIGRFIRRTRMDELPQLVNVLFGSMSMVGPRPERPEIAKKYEEIYPSFAFRTKVKAGITGFAQVFGRYNTAPEDKLFLDIMYIETFSILQDIKLMLQTVSVLFKPLSTEGIGDDSTTALR